MNPTIYFVTATLLALLALFLVWAILYALWSGLRSGPLTPAQQKKVLFYVGTAFFCWLSFLSLMSFTGFFEDFQSLPPRMLIAIVPPLLLILILLKSKRFAALLKRIPTSWLIYIQSFRIPMELVLWLGYLGGFIPFQMTFEGLNFDILVGISALFMGLAVHKKLVEARGILIWNIASLAILSVTVYAFISTYYLTDFLSLGGSIQFVEFPYLLLASVLLPVALFLHAFSLKQVLSVR